MQNCSTFRMARAFGIALLALAVLCPQADAQTRRVAGPEGTPQSFADLAESVKSAVVNVSTVSTVRGSGNPFNFFFGPQDQGQPDNSRRRFFGDVPDRETKQRSLGTGVIIDKTGFIVTNNHVVQRADDITVRMADGREFKAKVVGRDQKTDLALIKIATPAQNLPTLPLGDSEKMRVGDWVIAVGNPFGLAHTVTQGIISATGRVIGTGPYDNFIQTDAPINPGNSGGPLINMKGEVIGINTAITSTGQGIGFAIPSSMVKTIVTQLQDKGKVTRGWIGVSVQMITPEIAQSFGLKEPKGALIGDLVPGAPAEAAGMLRGDVIVSLDGKEVKSISDLPRLVAETPIGKTVPVRVIRQGKEVSLSVRMAEMPEERVAAPAGRAVPDKELGLAVENVTPRLQQQLNMKDRLGAVVVAVQPGSPAEEAGIQAGDVIREVNRTKIKDAADFRTALARLAKGSSVLLLLKRGSTTYYATVRPQ